MRIPFEPYKGTKGYKAKFQINDKSYGGVGIARAAADAQK